MLLFVEIAFILITVILKILYTESFCPVTRTDWLHRGQVLGCDEQKTYHCFRDIAGNNTEICMAARLIEPYLDGCPRFSRLKDRFLLVKPFKPCNISDCPGKDHRYYYTDELYKYLGCIPIDNIDGKPELTSNSPAELSTSLGKQDAGLLSAIHQGMSSLKQQHHQMSMKLGAGTSVLAVLFATVVITICVVVVIIIRRKLKGKRYMEKPDVTDSLLDKERHYRYRKEGDETQTAVSDVECQCTILNDLGLEQRILVDIPSSSTEST